jgi:hypothetical protein
VALYSIADAGFPQVSKLPERGTYNQPLSNADVNNGWSYTSIPSYAFMPCKYVRLPVALLSIVSERKRTFLTLHTLPVVLYPKQLS